MMFLSELDFLEKVSVFWSTVFKSLLLQLYPISMKSELANKRLAALAQKASESFGSEEIAAELMSLREIAREEKDPAITKIFRLAAEYIQANGSFDLGYLENDEEDVVEMSDFEYLMQLIIHCEREANRAEIKEFRNLLVSELY